MQRQSPHPLTRFSLIPCNDRTLTVLDHPNNRHLVSLIPGAKNPMNGDGQTNGLNIGFHIGSKSRYTLATLGRSGADIALEGANISRIQCSFEIHQDTDEIMLYDRSTTLSTQTYGEHAVPFEPGRCPRRVVVSSELNEQFGFGGAAHDLFQFKIHWHEAAPDMGERINYREDNPQFARTVDETPTILPSQRTTRIHTPGNGELKIRYKDGKVLGCGTFGVVCKAVNVDTGEIWALKRIKWPEYGLHPSAYTSMKREVETLYRISHVSQGLRLFLEC